MKWCTHVLHYIAGTIRADLSLDIRHPFYCDFAIQLYYIVTSYIQKNVFIVLIIIHIVRMNYSE